MVLWLKNKNKVFPNWYSFRRRSINSPMSVILLKYSDKTRIIPTAEVLIVVGAFITYLVH